jgi:hypothetical protein
VADLNQFDSRQWGDDIVLYSLKSGETHSLSVMHGVTLLTLMEQPEAAEPAEHWLEAMSAGDEPESASGAETQADLHALVDVLSDLERIGVVERVQA